MIRIELLVLFLFPSLIPYLITQPVLVQVIASMAILIASKGKIFRNIKNVNAILLLMTLATLNLLINLDASGTNIYVRFVLLVLVSSVVVENIDDDGIKYISKIISIIGYFSLVSFLIMSIDGPIGYFQTPNGREYGFTYFGFTTGDVGGLVKIYRQCGIFEEPGIFGTLCGLFIFRSESKKIEKIGIWAGGIASASLAFILIVLIGELSRAKINKLLAVMSGLGMIMVAAENLGYFDVFKYIIERIAALLTGSEYGDTRTHVARYILNQEDFINAILKGNLRLLSDPDFGMASIPSLLYVYGLPSILIGIYLIFWTEFKAKTRYLDVFLIFLVLTQRPNFFEPVYAVAIATYLRSAYKSQGRNNLNQLNFAYQHQRSRGVSGRDKRGVTSGA